MVAARGSFKEFAIYSNLFLIHLGGRPGPDLFLPYQQKPCGNDDGHGWTLLRWICTFGSSRK